MSILKYQTSNKFAEASHFKTKFSETAQENYSEEVRANGPKNMAKNRRKLQKSSLICRISPKNKTKWPSLKIRR